MELPLSQPVADLRASRMASDAARNRSLELENGLAGIKENVVGHVCPDDGSAALPVGQFHRGRLRLIRQRLPCGGHTDTDPIIKTKKLFENNLALSLKRGYVVAQELKGMGIEPKQLIAGGQGESNPIAPNDTKSNKSMNRRVQILAVARPNGQG